MKSSKMNLKKNNREFCLYLLNKSRNREKNIVKEDYYSDKIDTARLFISSIRLIDKKITITKQLIRELSNAK